MPNKIQAISPLVDHLMMLIEGSQCVSGKEFDIELALREALRNAAVHGNQEDPTRKVHIRCRCWPGKEISIVVTDQGKTSTSKGHRAATSHCSSLPDMDAASG
jgi:serine/threonine-protein kinase RsbW